MRLILIVLLMPSLLSAQSTAPIASQPVSPQSANDPQLAFALAVQSLESLDRAGAPANQILEALDLVTNAGLRLVGGWPAAVPFGQRAVALYDQIGGSSAASAVAWTRLADLLDRSGRFAEARTAIDRALAHAEQVWPPLSAESIGVSVTAAIVDYHSGDLERCVRHGRRVVAFEEPRGDSVALSNALRSLALCLNGLTDPETVEMSRRARDVAARLGHSTALSRAQMTVGNTHGAWGYPLEALEALDQALHVRRAQSPPSHEWIARLLVRQADVRVQTGDWEGAQLALVEALSLFERYAPQDSEYSEGVFLSGRVRWALGDRDGARAHLTRGLDLIRQVWGDTHTVMAHRLEEYAVILADQNLAAARDVARQALDIAATRGQVLLRAPLIMAQAVADSDPGAARAWLQQAYDAVRRLNLDDKGVRVALAASTARAGDVNEAWRLWLEAEEVGRARSDALTAGLAERQALLAAKEYRESLDGLLGFLSRHGDSHRVREAFDRVIHRRAAVLDELAARRRLATSVGASDLRASWDRLAAARERLARLMVASQTVRAEILQDARAGRDAAERALAAGSGTFRANQQLLRVGFDEVRSGLPADTTLVSYVRFEDLELPTDRGRYGVFVLGPGQAGPVFVSLGSADGIDRLVTTFRSQIRRELDAAGIGGQRNERVFRKAASALRRRIWDPIVSHLGQGEQVLVVPDGPLGLINFSALPLDRDGYLIERRSIHSLTAERDVVPAPATERIPAGLIAFGNPAYDTRPQSASATAAGNAAAAGASRFRGSIATCAPFRDRRFNPLPASQRETIDVARIWSGAGSSASETLTVTGGEASETAFKFHAPGRRVLHVATHGFFLDDACDQNANGIAENALTFAGLAFAGANRRAATTGEEDDGILTAEEVAALDLSGTEWAVLSGCDTGVGTVQVGEGVLGFRRAFHAAGARTTIMSLWPVGDASTRTWMQALYQSRFRDGRSTADAVRAATLSSLRGRRTQGISTHPFYWAGFVASGDWR